MKCLMNTALALSLCAGLALPAGAAQVGEVVDYALHTDIVAQINGHPLRSYNVGGRTAVVVRDLEEYGFVIQWDAMAREVRLLRRVDSQNAPVTPVSWPEYTPDKLKAPVGSRAENIYATNIKTYVSGAQVESFNIGGKTLIWFNDLASYGDVVWDETSRTADLVLGDPMEIGLRRMIQPLLDWDDLVHPDRIEESYQLYPNEYGTLFVGKYSGTSHGTAYRMAFVKRNGNVVDVDELMPVYGFGRYYLAPEEIRLEGETLWFVSPVKDEAAAVTELGKCLVKVDLNMGRLLSMQPLEQRDQ